MPASRASIIVDTGPPVAAINSRDPHHIWARSVFLAMTGRYVTTEAALTEAVHLLDNHRKAVTALSVLVSRMEVFPLAPNRVSEAVNLVAQWAPDMDYADACAVILVREPPHAFVLTTDRRDFATYRVPFACPDGAFHA